MRRRMDQIVADDIAQLLQTYTRLNAKPGFPHRNGGRNQVLTYWHTIYKVLKEKKYIKDYEDRIPKAIRSQKKPKRLLPEGSIEAIIALIDEKFGAVHGTAFRLGFYLGLRSVEVSKATWRCINWERREWVNYDTKGLESTGLPIPQVLMDHLKNLKTSLGGNPLLSVPVCPLESGDAAGSTTRIIRYALEVAGKQILGHTLSTHDLRATYITGLHNKGVNIKVIQKLARHADISTTLSYIILEESDMRSAIDRVYGGV